MNTNASDTVNSKLYELSDILDQIDAQRTEKLAELEKQYAATKKELTEHLKRYSRKHETICAGADCRVKAVAKLTSTKRDFDGLAELAKSLGATDEQVKAFVTEGSPTWAIG